MWTLDDVQCMIDTIDQKYGSAPIAIDMSYANRRRFIQLHDESRACKTCGHVMTYDSDVAIRPYTSIGENLFVLRCQSPNDRVVFLANPNERPKDGEQWDLIMDLRG